MEILTIRNLDPSVKAKLRERAAVHGRSMEAEVRTILTEVVSTPDTHTDLAESVMRHFSETPVQLELPDRTQARQRPIAFDS